MKTTARGRAVERFRGNRLFEEVDADIIERIVPKLGVLRKKLISSRAKTSNSSNIFATKATSTSDGLSAHLAT